MGLGSSSAPQPFRSRHAAACPLEGLEQARVWVTAARRVKGETLECGSRLALRAFNSDINQDVVQLRAQQVAWHIETVKL